MCEWIQDSGLELSIGNGAPLGPDPDLVLVGKPPVSSNRHLGEWLCWLERRFARGTRIVCDYSDNHLSKGSTEPIYRFYERLFSISEVVTVPTMGLCDWLETNGWVPSNRIKVIPDLNEYEDLIGAPRRLDPPEKLGLWFGHPTNFPYLADFLSTNADMMRDEKLFVVTSKKAIESLGWVDQRWVRWPSTTVWLKPVLWSQSSMRLALEAASYCIIPADVSSLRKQFASPNRLITALSAGIPTAATALKGTEELKQYFLQIESSQARDLIENPLAFDHLPKAFATQAAWAYGRVNIAQQWRNALDSEEALYGEAGATTTGGGGIRVPNHEL